MVKFATQYAEAGGISDSEDNKFTGTGSTKDDGAWQGWTFQKDVLQHGGSVGTAYFKKQMGPICECLRGFHKTVEDVYQIVLMTPDK